MAFLQVGEVIKVIYELSLDNYIEIIDGEATQRNQYDSVDKAIEVIQRRHTSKYSHMYGNEVGLVVGLHFTSDDLGYIIQVWDKTIDYELDGMDEIIKARATLAKYRENINKKLKEGFKC